MKARGALCLVLAFLALAACRKEQVRDFTLTGSAPACASDSILVTGMDSRFDRVDTIRTDASGRFTYLCELDTVTPLILIWSDGQRDVVFGDKYLSAELKRDSAGVAHVTGGLANAELQEFMVMTEADTTQTQIIAHIDSFISRHPVSEVSPYLIYKYCVSAKDFNASRTLKLIDGLSGQMKDNVFISDIMSDLKSSNRSSVILDNFQLRDTADVKVRLGTLCEEGHVLVCMYSSWNRESREALKWLAEMEEEFKDKEFCVAGISIDPTFERFRQAIDEDSLGIGFYREPEGLGSDLLVQLETMDVPYYFLMDSKRRVEIKSASQQAIQVKLGNTLQDRTKGKKKETAKKASANTPAKGNATKNNAVKSSTVKKNIISGSKALNTNKLEPIK